MSVIPAMKSLLEDVQDVEGTDLAEWEDAIGNLLAFCEETGIELESEEDTIEAVLDEVDAWLVDSDLTEDEKEQLAEFAKAIKKLAFKGARAVGKVHKAYQGAKAKVGAVKAKVKSFGHGVKTAARAGYAAGHKNKPAGKKPMKVKMRPGKGKKPVRKPGGRK